MGTHQRVWMRRCTGLVHHLQPRSAAAPFFSVGGMGNSPMHHAGPRMEAILQRRHIDSGARERATVAGGCFWGLELAYQRLPGVIKTSVGYINGHVKDPSYEEVCSGMSGHAEAVDVEFDPETISYDDIIDVFWEQHDPTTLNRQVNFSAF